MPETIVVSNGPAGPLEHCSSRTFPAFVTLRRSQSSSDSGFPTYRLASVLHNGSPATYRVDRDRFDSVSLCLGGNDAVVARGEHTFELRYTTTDRLIELYDQDRFFLDITGSDLTIPIRRASATVHLPKGADTVRADGYAGLRNRKHFTTELMETADGDVIAYTVTRPLPSGRELEDNIEYARRYYNATVRDYNVATAVFPSRIVAAAFMFTPEEFFELDSPVEERKGVNVAFS